MMAQTDLQNSIYEKLLARSGGLLPGEAGEQREAALRDRAAKLARYLDLRAGRLQDICNNCREHQARREFTRHVYDTPWESSPHEVHFCSEECEERYMDGGDFSYWYCGACHMGNLSAQPAERLYVPVPRVARRPDMPPVL